MLTPPFTFDDIMAPLGAERFFAEHNGKQPLHLKGSADKFAEVMNWAKLNELLGMATIWSQESLGLYLDKEPIPATSYCASAIGRDGGRVLRPDPVRVKRYLHQGATLFANDIDHLGAGLTAFSTAMEQALCGKVQGNLYCSSRRRPGFAAHFDTHDVFAVHVEGTKTWHVYEGRAVDPIAHPKFKTLGREHHEKAKGEMLMEVQMEPGDLLYLPRGQYHDALADEGGAVHIAFGVTYPIGMDVLSLLWDWMLDEPVFRANLPQPDQPGSKEALLERLMDFVEKIGATLAESRTTDRIQRMQRGYRYPRSDYDLVELLSEPAGERYKVRAHKVRLVEQGGRFGLLREGSRSAIEVPAEFEPIVNWVLKRTEFSRTELADAFPQSEVVQLDQVLRDLGAMRLTESI